MFERKQKQISKLVEDNLDYLVRFAFFRLGDRECAEDMVYEAILRVLNKPLAIDVDKFRSYLFRTVYNLCQDELRNRFVTVPIEGVDVPDENDALDREEADRINSLLAVIPEKEREVVMMRVVDELSFVEIGDILSLPSSTVKSRFKSGMDRMKQIYFSKIS